MKKNKLVDKIIKWKASNQPFGDITLHESFDERVAPKYKIPFTCLRCGTGNTGKWVMQLNNVLNGVGCPVCKSINEVQFLFNESFLVVDYDLGFINSNIEKPNISSISYTLTDNQGCTSPPIKRNYLLSCIREKKVPYLSFFENQVRIREKVKDIELRFKVEFPKGNISYDDSRSKGSSDLFFKVNLKNFFGELIENTISLKKVNNLILHERCNKERAQILIKKAQSHGAKVLEFKRVKNSKVVVYLSRSGYQCSANIYRAQNEKFNWGQRGHKGEALCKVIFQELFPNYEWRFNIRPSFLKYKTGFNLELDGYCKVLGLAFEHQGRQHYEQIGNDEKSYNNFVLTQERDSFKEKKCKEVGITLVIIDAQELSIQKYIKEIIIKLNEKSLDITENYSVKNIEEKWSKYCKNPLSEFQDLVIKSLGDHKIIFPNKDKINKSSKVIYKCNYCGELNKVKASGLKDGKPRSYCPQCKGKVFSNQREEINKALSKKLPEYISKHIRHENQSFFLVCPLDSNHVTEVTDISESSLDNKHFHKSKYMCLQCELQSNNLEDVPENRAALKVMWQKKDNFIYSIESLGLKVVGQVKLRRSSESKRLEMYARVACRGYIKNHIFYLGSREIRQLKNNKFLKESFVHSKCLKCAYPGPKPKSLQSTVFHRLNFLRKFHPNVKYISGFDSSGKALERYNCGENFEISGKSHPDFYVRAHTIGSKEKASKLKTPCYVCGVLNNNIPRSDKSIEMLEGRMIIIIEKISQVFHDFPLTTPTVRKVEESSNEKITSSTKLIFHCGNASHETEISNFNNYFSIHKRGFCKECLKVAKIKSIYAEFGI
uniref:hypothetical protein n=1 Tax=uncultured Psychrobacter sp. TaxID=259303 RepID=UPI0026251D4B|nr:hypothetical protein [uncultured Psychrobacter sp.]